MSRLQRILVPGTNLVKRLTMEVMSSKAVPQIPKSIPSGIDLLKKMYEKDGDL